MNKISDQAINETLNLIRQNRKIEAIKFLMEHSNLGLKESKDFVDALQANPELKQIKSDKHQSVSHHLYQDNIDTYRKIRINLTTQDVWIIDHEGQKILIDEHHPLWNAALTKFGGKVYPTKSEYLETIRNKNTELDQQSTTLQRYTEDKSSTALHTHIPPTIGVEKRKPIFNMITLILICTVIIVSIAIVLQH
ncbi:hypothetical protein [Acinetobacter stercoris]|uniref:50S ribosomal protein L7/L12 n=1 Tax=Acinetobacter stercoris TaxID=2126983 RepID=A0A2U3MWE8_9GAMM|nr:hypothetical protein [Acinetobacter stercoris]SPL69629.1 hypothetical protein KPC_0807 [Acinetobacter stercoris]